MKPHFFLFKSYIGRLVMVYGLAVVMALSTLYYFRDHLASLQVDSFAGPVVKSELVYFTSVYEKEGLKALIDVLEDYQNRPDQGFRYALINKGRLLSGKVGLFSPNRIFMGAPHQRLKVQHYEIFKDPRVVELNNKVTQLHILPEKPQVNYWVGALTNADTKVTPFNFVVPDQLLKQDYQIIESLNLARGLFLIAAFDTRSLENPGIFLNQILVGLCLLIVAGFITTSVIGWKIHSRLTGINQTASDILQHNDLSRRIPGGMGSSEFDLLSRNLNLMLAGIEQKMEDMRHLSNNIAHDMRTPLTLLRNRVEQLGKSKNAKDEERELALSQMDQILETFNAILRISNLESGTIQIEKENIDLAHVLQDVIDLYDPLARKKRQELHHHLDSYLIYADRNLLFQALANIIDNAVKYTPSGGKIILSAERKSQVLEVYIDDNGPGIPEDKLDTVLRRFKRLDQSRSTPGTGLGLSLVKAIMDAHQGNISLSNYQGGLRIKLVFPRKG